MAGRLERRGDAQTVAPPADRAWSDRASSSGALRRWPAVVALVVVAHLGFGIFGRGLWKPDEPREAAIAARMARPGADLAVPHLGRDAFCEKPPLYYWLAALSSRVIGGGPVSARLPNLAYALAGALLVGLLARTAGGPLAALAAGVAMGTLYLAYRVEVWIATDALLMASVAGALLGCYRGLAAPRGGSKLAWYAFMHACLAVGFLTKNAVAWMVPGLALLVVVAWTKRWRELLAWELIAGFAIQVAAVLPWVFVVAAQPQGSGYLRTFFFNNLVGRFTAVEGVGYTKSHPGWPGAYLVELPAYLLPWTLLFVAAAAAAWFATRSASTSRGDPSPQTLAWRFAVAAIVPGLVALSASATMRDIYAGVLMPGFALLGGLWVAHAAAAPGRLDLAMVKATAALLVALGLLLPPFLLAAVVHLRAATPWLPLLLLLVGWLAAVGLAWSSWKAARQGRLAVALAHALAGWVVVWSCGAPLVFPVVNRAQDIAPVAREAAALAASHPLALWRPDETIIGVLDLEGGLTPPHVYELDELQRARALTPDLRLVAEATRSKGSAQAVAELLAASGMSVERRIDLPAPGGRSYVILGPAGAP